MVVPNACRCCAGRVEGGGFIHEAMSLAHADALQVLCDPDAVLESVEIRATCSEGIIAIAAITAIYHTAWRSMTIE